MATIYDVAQRAGVSPSTVSRVFNNIATISQATRERVLASAAELDFQPNILGSALTTNQTLMVGLVITDIRNPYSASLARGVQDALSRDGYVCIICNTDADPTRTHGGERYNSRRRPVGDAPLARPARPSYGRPDRQ